jgi:dTDP-D-glucose 4,6-dehydratase
LLVNIRAVSGQFILSVKEQSMKLLISGGAGFIGPAVIRQIIRHTSNDVVNLDKLTYTGNFESLADASDSIRYACEQLVGFESDQAK